MNNVYRNYIITHNDMKFNARFYGTHFGQTKLLLYKTKEFTFATTVDNEDYVIGPNVVQALDNYHSGQKHRKFEIKKSR